jgi:activator of HSP90 ATPase
MKTKSISKTVRLKSSPPVVYNMLMDSKKHAAFTGSPVKMSKKVKGTFSVFDGYCTGYNIELIENFKIVQAWNFKEDGWPSDHFSICAFLLEIDEKNTILTFTQTGIPEHKASDLRKGWNEFYWEAMKLYLKKNKK